MPVSSAVRQRVRTFLQPGEDIRYVFPAAWVNPSPFVPSFIFVVTDVSVTVLSTGALNRTRPKSVWGRYPRDTRIGPVEMAPGPVFTFGRTVFEVNEEYVPVVNAADAEISSPDLLPEDPLPDL